MLSIERFCHIIRIYILKLSIYKFNFHCMHKKGGGCTICYGDQEKLSYEGGHYLAW